MKESENVLWPTQLHMVAMMWGDPLSWIPELANLLLVGMFSVFISRFGVKILFYWDIFMYPHHIFCTSVTFISIIECENYASQLFLTYEWSVRYLILMRRFRLFSTLNSCLISRELPPKVLQQQGTRCDIWVTSVFLEFSMWVFMWAYHRSDFLEFSL
jgi:hypothetical protein